MCAGVQNGAQSLFRLLGTPLFWFLELIHSRKALMGLQHTMSVALNLRTIARQYNSGACNMTVAAVIPYYSTQGREPDTCCHMGQATLPSWVTKISFPIPKQHRLV